MKTLIVSIFLALVGTVYAGNSITFTQDGVDVTSVAVGSLYQINGDTNVKNTSMYLCVQNLPQNTCQIVITDGRGNFSVPSSIDTCNYELCDFSPKKELFMIIRPGTSKPILATADLTFE